MRSKIAEVSTPGEAYAAYQGNAAPGPVRVLAAIDCLEVGGAQHHLLQLAAGLAPAGYAFTVATSGSEPLAIRFEEEKVPVQRLVRRSIKHRLSPVFATRLTRLARSGRYDLIHGHLHSASVAAAVAARLSGLPLVLTHHSMNTWQRGWQRALGAWAAREADASIVVATNIATALKARRAHTIPNGVHQVAETWSEVEIARARKQLGVPAHAYLVAFVGRLTTDKNPVRFVEVAALVAERSPRAHFLVVGDGPLRGAAEARATALGLDGRITFAGFRPEAAELLQAMDVLAVTSDSEGSPLVVLEAMAVGTPVVATAVGDVPYQIADGETGFILPPHDVAGLAEALLRLTDGGLRAQLGETARARVADDFSVEQMLARTQAVYTSVAPVRRAARSIS